jgi:transposase-like protein
MLSAQQKTQKGQELPIFTESEARAYFEAQRWPDGAVCPHCSSKDAGLLQGKASRDGLYQCRACRQQFTVTVGTVMEDSHLPLSKWALAFHFMATAKKGMSALQLMRNLGLGSYRTAWHLAHRIREAMKGPIAAGETPEPMKGTVEVDETYVGGKTRGKGKAFGMKNKVSVVSLVERETGTKRSFIFPNVSAEKLLSTIKEQTAESAEIHTDASSLYTRVALRNEHHAVNHTAGEYVRYQLDARKPGGVNTVTTNLVESSFALLKRGVYGTFHNVSKKHLHRYVCEFDFRWNERFITDVERRDVAVKGSEGKRLMYKEPACKPPGHGTN